MTEELYVKLEYGEAVQTKKNLLSSEINLLMINRSIRDYKSLRLKELKLKNSLNTRIKSFLVNLKKIETTLPKVKIKKIQEEIEEVMEVKKPVSNDIETQLREIQEKLKGLQ